MNTFIETKKDVCNWEIYSKFYKHVDAFRSSIVHETEDAVEQSWNQKELCPKIHFY